LVIGELSPFECAFRFFVLGEDNPLSFVEFDTPAPSTISLVVLGRRLLLDTIFFEARRILLPRLNSVCRPPFFSVQLIGEKSKKNMMADGCRYVIDVTLTSSIIVSAPGRPILNTRVTMSSKVLTNRRIPLTILLHVRLMHRSIV
jgi:hypothetical protein